MEIERGGNLKFVLLNSVFYTFGVKLHRTYTEISLFRFHVCLEHKGLIFGLDGGFWLSVARSRDP